MSFTPPPPPVFTGENYHIWVVKMKTYLQAHDLWSVVENDAEPPPLRANPTERLKEEFIGSDKTRQQQVINLRRDFENLKMKESESIKQYSDRIMATVNSIRLLGEDFSESRIVEKVITTLPERFESKISSLEDSRDLTTISLSELVNSLYALEQKRANRQEENSEGAFQAKAKESSSANKKGKKPWLDKKDKFRKDSNKRSYPPSKGKAPVQQQDQAHSAEDQQAKEEHVFSASSLELNMSFSSRIRIGNRSLIEAKGRGDVLINLSSSNKLITDVLYVPDIDQNLLSVGQLVEKGYSLFFRSGSCVIEDSLGQEVVTVPMADKCFMLDVSQLKRRAYLSQSDSAGLWHKRLGHVNFRLLDLLHKLGLAEDMTKVEPLEGVCDVCQLGKQARLSFPVDQAWRARETLELVHSDICGPMKTPSLNGSKYFLLFIDDLTRFCWTFFLKQKSDVFEAFGKFKAMVENQTGCRIKTLRTNNGAEYLSDRFKRLCEQAGIHHQLTTVYTPQQNGVCERKNRTVMDMARCLLFQSKLPNSFSTEAVNSSVYLLNRLPTYAVKDKTPFEAWHGLKPSVSHLEVFGYVCYVLVPAERRTKLERRKILVSRDIRFDEKKIWNWDGLNANQFEEDSAEGNLELVEIEPSNGNVDDLPVRGTRSIANVYQRCNVAIVEPSSYEEAARDTN
ncbi:hypothetical protein CXB51_024938 [Gossypium anomalum]|uniref:Integrase catalytic domain-containing protein n=1 Tax=Gossypium anomalum TaxID=47600 RepID=A0A8J6CU74_9ROSI|nr:hypothetical protein CXB51_024938 [Gossypium anomalum]